MWPWRRRRTSPSLMSCGSPLAWRSPPGFPFGASCMRQSPSIMAADKDPGASYGSIHGNERILFEEEVEFISTSSRQANQEAIQEVQADLRQRKTPAVRLVSEVIQVAMAKRASDIHIEPRASDTVVRMRVDGVLHDQQLLPRALQNSLISRVKILSDMDISERRDPSGRSLHGFHRQPAARSPCLDLADPVWRESRNPVAGDERSAGQLRRPGNGGRRLRRAYRTSSKRLKA